MIATTRGIQTLISDRLIYTYYLGQQHGACAVAIYIVICKSKVSYFVLPSSMVPDRDSVTVIVFSAVCKVCGGTHHLLETFATVQRIAELRRTKSL